MNKKKAVSFILAVMFAFAFQAAVIQANANDDFRQAHYDKALKGHKNLKRAKLENANLKGANLSGVNFYKADLEEADLQDSNLSNANFRNADLEGANLKGANAEGAIFKGAELEDAIWIDGRKCADDSIGVCR